MLMVYRPPTSPNQARLQKASQAPNLSTKTSCNLNLKRWHSSLHLKKFARLWVSSFSKRMPILLRKRKTSFAMLCSNMKSCQNLKSSSSQTREASEKSKDFGDRSLPLMLSSLASGICTRQRKLIRMQWLCLSTCFTTPTTKFQATTLLVTFKFRKARRLLISSLPIPNLLLGQGNLVLISLVSLAGCKSHDFTA